MKRSSSCLIFAVLGLACDPPVDEGPSSLEQRANDKGTREDGAPRADQEKLDEAPGPGEASETSQPTPAPDGKRVKLHLRLAEDTHYRVVTIGQVKLPLVGQSIPFAREEDLVLGACAGEGATRKCTLTHTYRNFEAAPPAGKALELDEKSVSELTSAHGIDAGGRKLDAATVTGPKNVVESPPGKALVDAHRFYCLRLPEEAVGVGARWVDHCQAREGGQLATREVEWEVVKLDEDPELGTKAELRMKGNYTGKDAEGNERKGTIQGVLYFMASVGEPLMFRQRYSLELGDSGARTTTDLRIQFAVFDPKKPDELLRPDGKPFPGGSKALNAPVAPADPNAVQK